MIIFSPGDEPEKVAANKHNLAHTKYGDTVRKFYTRLQAEETKYKERMEELQVGCHDNKMDALSYHKQV